MTQGNTVAAQHAIIGNVVNERQGEFQRNAHPDAQWFPEAGLGLFLHFGIASVLGEGDLSWSMMKVDNYRTRQAKHGIYAVQANITPARYWEQAKDFKADKFDPVKILSAAKRAGCQYAVLTTRHHDGFALWPSRHGDFNLGHYQPNRDLVKEFVAGCRQAGLRIAFYYSPPDWYFNRDYMSFNYGEQQPMLDVHHRPCELPPKPAGWDAGYRAYIKGQVEELLSNYGKIDVLWFDGHGQDAITIERLRELQPGILINPRAHGVGDFDTAECVFPKQRFPGWWEYCHVFSDGAWGYLNHDTYKPAGWFLAELAKARAWGGNFLPNVGPDAHGELPEAYYKRMEQIAQWMKTGAESVFGVQPGPWPERSNVPVTIRGHTWYLHFDLLNEGAATITGVGHPCEVKLLRTGEPLPFEFSSGTLTITVPNDSRSTLDDVVAVKFA